MVTYNRPGVYTEEVDRARRPIQAVPTSIPAFFGVAQRGPAWTPTFITGMTDFERVFGLAIAGEALHYAAEGFFKNGGAGCYIVRVAHYTDPNTGVVAASAAYADIAGQGTAAFAEFVGNADATSVALTAGHSLTFDVNNLGGLAATFNAVAAIVTGAAGTFLSADGNTTCEYSIDGGPTKSVSLSGVADGVANYVNSLNAQMEGVRVEEAAGQLKITSDSEGSGSSIALSNFGSNFAAITGLSAATTPSAGPNNVASIDAVSFAELKAVIEDAVKTAVAGDRLVVTQDAGTGYLRLTVSEGVAGAASELDLSAGDAALLSALGLTGLGSQGANPVATGSATAAAPALRLWAGYRGKKSPGVDGNELSIEVLHDPKYLSAGVGQDLSADVSAAADTVYLTSLAGIEVGSYVLLTEGGTTEVARVTLAETTVQSGVVQHRVKFSAGLTNAFVAANTTVQSLEHTIRLRRGVLDIRDYTQLSMNPEADNYALTVINDSEIGSNWLFAEDLGVAFPGNALDVKAETRLSGGTTELASFAVADILGSSVAKSGFHALDSTQDMSLLCVPPSFGGVTTIPANSVVHNAMLQYAKNREDCFAVLDMPASLNRAQALNYRRNTLGTDSKWGALYHPHIEVADPLGSGSSPTVYVPPSGHVTGVYARVDAIGPPSGGVATAPAGVGDHGKVLGALGLQVDIGDADQEELNPAGVNCLRKFAQGGALAPGIVVWGARTLSTDTRWKYVNVRRLFTMIELSIVLGTRWAVFRNNDYRTWERVKNSVESFLRNLYANGQLAGRTASEAFFVKIDEETTTADDIDAGRMIAQVGIAPQKPAEFIIFRISQEQAAGSTTEL